MFIVDKNLPYYLGANGKVYPCEIDALTYKVDFSKGKPALAVSSVLTENEVRAKLGIKLVDSWDEVNKRVVKVTNKKVSSLLGFDKK